jgi:hypothetical protein
MRHVFQLFGQNGDKSGGGAARENAVPPRELTGLYNTAETHAGPA